jgi:hypothetical protein
MDKDNGAPRSEDDVWPARQVVRMKPVSISQAMKESSNDQLWSGVFGPDRSHVRTALR